MLRPCHASYLHGKIFTHACLESSKLDESCDEAGSNIGTQRRCWLLTSTDVSHATLQYSLASKSLHSLRSSPKGNLVGGLVSLATSKFKATFH